MLKLQWKFINNLLFEGTSSPWFNFLLHQTRISMRLDKYSPV